MTPIKLIVSDIDGTLLDSEGRISAANIDAVQAAIAVGVPVVLASARVRVGMAKFARQVGTSAPMICCDGAQIYRTPEGPLWYQLSLPDEIVAEITSLADQHGFELVSTAGDNTYYRQRDGELLGEYEPGRVRLADNRAVLDFAPVSRIVVYDLDGLDLLHEHCQQYGDLIRAHLFALPGKPPHSLGIFAMDADKGYGIRFLMQQLDLQPEQVLAVGDNFNDLPMFQAAGVRVAMGNAPDEVKQQVDYVAPDYDHSGLAWAIHEVLGIENGL